MSEVVLKRLLAGRTQIIFFVNNLSKSLSIPTFLLHKFKKIHIFYTRKKCKVQPMPGGTEQTRKKMYGRIPSHHGIIPR